jgi:thioredoxin 2
MNEASGSQIVRCPQCGASNRVDRARLAGRAAVCGRCKNTLSAAAAPSSPITVTDGNFAEAVGNSPLPVLLDFWAAWCGPCRQIAPVVERLAAELAGKALIGKLNVDENQGTAARFGVQSIPTLLIFKNGREVDRLVGLQSREAILRRLQTYL